jgi:uncharacterized protein YbjT (DUF2867 family)
MTHILIAGATGLVGSTVLDQVDAVHYRVTAVGRRASGKPGVSDKLISHFAAPLELPRADIALCALGTTIADAGSKAAFRAIDHDAVLGFAAAAQRAGVKQFILVSAVGANANAKVFYSRVKGETERDLQALGFTRLDIAQPGLLLGARKAHRPVESMLQRADRVARHFMPGPLDRYTGIQAKTVGRALLALCQKQHGGVYRHENRHLRALARE